ncbi:MAG: hypothetical protein KDD06_29900 [Phaeodactylibacter sp.]|nr:hypothetical protein [Phaeodactylibacter sp.]MCB9288712.1 hypothetical protein [Lewinellaceae bacterium]
MKKAIIIILAAMFLLPRFSNAQACIEPTSDEGVQVIGFIQPQMEYNFLGKDLAGNSLDESSFYFNRARLGVTGKIPYDFSYYFLMEFSPTLNGSKESRAPFLLDAFVSYNRFAPYAKVSLGQFKSPFGLEALTACHKLHTINRSDVVIQTQGLFRDQGIMISGGTGNLSLFGSKTENLIGYNLAVMNGSGLNTWDVNNKKDIIARLTLRPFEFITLGASYRTGKQPPVTTTAEKDDVRRRLGLDAEFKYKNILVQGEFIKAEDIGSYTTGGGCSGDLEVHEGTLTRNGFFVQAAYMTPWNLQPIVRMEEYLVPMNNDENMWNGSLFEGLFGETDDQAYTTITYGVNYFFNEWTRLQVNYLYRAEKGSLTEVDNDALLVQMQISF